MKPGCQCLQRGSNQWNSAFVSMICGTNPVRQSFDVVFAHNDELIPHLSWKLCDTLCANCFHLPMWTNEQMLKLVIPCFKTHRAHGDVCVFQKRGHSSPPRIGQQWCFVFLDDLVKRSLICQSPQRMKLQVHDLSICGFISFELDTTWL